MIAWLVFACLVAWVFWFVAWSAVLHPSPWLWFALSPEQYANGAKVRLAQRGPAHLKFAIWDKAGRRQRRCGDKYSPSRIIRRSAEIAAGIINEKMLPAGRGRRSSNMVCGRLKRCASSARLACEQRGNRFSPVRVKLTTRLPGVGSRAAQFSSVNRFITAAPARAGEVMAAFAPVEAGLAHRTTRVRQRRRCRSAAPPP